MFMGRAARLFKSHFPLFCWQVNELISIIQFHSEQRGVMAFKQLFCGGWVLLLLFFLLVVLKFSRSLLHKSKF